MGYKYGQGSSYSGYGKSKKGKKKFPDPLIIALQMLIVSGLLNILNSFFFEFSWIFVYPLQILIYIITGYRAGAAYFATHKHLPYKAKPKAVQDGAVAGLTLSILGWLVTLIVAFITGFFTIGITWFSGTVSLLICGPGDVIAGLFLGALGAKICEWRR